MNDVEKAVETVDFMDEARQLASQCWCDPETQDRVMDPPLAEAVAKRIAVWMDTAAQFNRNEDFYRGIVCQVGEMFGNAAKTSDDGSLQDSVLALKVPELVRDALAARRAEAAEGEKLVDEAWLRSIGFVTSPNDHYVQSPLSDIGIQLAARVKCGEFLAICEIGRAHV